MPRTYTGKTGTMVLAKQNEEERQDITSSKLTLAGHNLEGISIACQVSQSDTSHCASCYSVLTSCAALPTSIRVVYLCSLTCCQCAAKYVLVFLQETCIILPSANLVFDSGRCPQRSVPRGKLFLTHEHLDHMGGIPAHICSRYFIGCAIC